MEFSLARSLEGSLEIANVPFPHLSSDPAIDQVNPGIGQLVSLYDTVVPMRGHSLHAIEKKVESALEEQTDELTQIITMNIGATIIGIMGLMASN